MDLYLATHLLLSASIIVPLIVLTIGLARGKRITDMPEIGLSAVLLILLAALMTSISRALDLPGAVRISGLPEILAIIIVTMGVINAVMFPTLRKRLMGAQRGGQAFDNTNSTLISDEHGAKTHCSPSLYLDPGLAKSWSKRDGTGLLSAALPANAYVYHLSIDFTVAQTSVTVEAFSKAAFRPWYGWFLLSLLSFDRAASSSARGVVDCRSINNRCFIHGVGNSDVASDVECSVAAVVNVLSQSDPALVVLEASGAASFIGQKTTSGITLSTQINSSSGSTGSVSTPNPGGGGTTAGTSSTSGLQVSAQVTINMPTIADLKKKLTRPVSYRCVATETT